MRRPGLPLGERLAGISEVRHRLRRTAVPPAWSRSDRIDRPIFTPATKAEAGHDENVPFETMARGDRPRPDSRASRTHSIDLYQTAAVLTPSRGLILADTKFEWGRDAETGEILLIDEVLTPDSSRYWPKDDYKPGGPQPSFDKQYVRDWLETPGWDKASPPPPFPTTWWRRPATSTSRRTRP